MKNLVNTYENFGEDDILDGIFEETARVRASSKSKLLGRQDSKRGRTSYISAAKKAGGKMAVKTEEIEELNKTLLS
jgi:hypothetical protein